MPVILLWGIPTLFVVAGGGWWLMLCIINRPRARSAFPNRAFSRSSRACALCVRTLDCHHLERAGR